MSKYSELAGLLEGCLSFAYPNLSESRQDALTREAAAALRELEAERDRLKRELRAANKGAERNIKVAVAVTRTNMELKDENERLRGGINALLARPDDPEAIQQAINAMCRPEDLARAALEDKSDE